MSGSLRHRRRESVCGRGIRHRIARKGIESPTRPGLHRWTVERRMTDPQSLPAKGIRGEADNLASGAGTVGAARSGERTMSWLAGCRSLHPRYERKSEHFLAFTSIACTLICYRTVSGPEHCSASGPPSFQPGSADRRRTHRVPRTPARPATARPGTPCAAPLTGLPKTRNHPSSTSSPPQWRRHRVAALAAVSCATAVAVVSYAIRHTPLCSHHPTATTCANGRGCDLPPARVR
ncbi:hypothetical protein QF027_000309 [Streptomyces canus]|nr:hypothetical protein [Streptomyces canus]